MFNTIFKNLIPKQTASPLLHIDFFESLRKSDYSKIGFEVIEKIANTRKISIRSGCFYNPGLDETNNCISNEELVQYFTSRQTGDYWDMIASLKKIRGATRVSLGIATNQNDLDSFISFVEEMKD